METVTLENLPRAVAEMNREMNRKVDLLTDLVNRAVNGDSDNTTLGDGDKVFVEGAAKMMNKTKATIYAMTHRNEIPHYKRGNRLYFSKKEIQEYLKAGRVKTVEEIQSDAMENLKRK